MPFINIIFGRNLLTGDFVAVLLAFWWSYETAGTEHKVGTIECIGGFRGGRTGSGPRLEPVAGHELYTCAGQEKDLSVLEFGTQPMPCLMTVWIHLQVFLQPLPYFFMKIIQCYKIMVGVIFSVWHTDISFIGYQDIFSVCPCFQPSYRHHRLSWRRQIIG